jgi:hypothetical protein
VLPLHQLALSQCLFVWCHRAFNSSIVGKDTIYFVFDVFVTLSSQRPNDVSHMITSRARSYFIHRLINQKELESIASAVSYIDKLTEESIPTLPSARVFSAGQSGLKLAIKPLQERLQPRSSTLRFQIPFLLSDAKSQAAG